jgi:hypothetical protein
MQSTLYHKVTMRNYGPFLVAVVVGLNPARFRSNYRQPGHNPILGLLLAWSAA